QEPALINDLLAGVKPEIAEDIGKALAYPPDSAGALMDTNVIYFHPEMLVSAALARLRAQQRRGFRVVFVVDDDQHLVGMVEIQDLALADGNDRLIKLVRKIPALVSELTTKEEIVEILDRYRLTDLAVVDFGERLIGVVRYHALMDAAREESSADIQTMVGVSKDERAFSSVGFTVRKRLPWLHINLVTAFMAAAVVGIFEDTIAAYTALAVLLPVVAGQSGNAGAQALAVTMRGLALREARIRDWKRIVMKEFNVGLLNGIAVAITAAICAGIWSGSVGIAIILTLSMIISLVIAGVTGAAIPILLTKFGQDPATASSIFLTTVTDVAGFFSFLGIATLLAGLL
ncbi:MAG: magnesium transporter, partial [Balneolales bacterium]